MKLKIGFLGAGKMATALAKGFASANLVKPNQLVASDVVEAARDFFQADTGAPCVVSNLEVVNSANLLIVAVKPQQVPDLLKEIHPAVTRNHLVISIAAGVPIKRFEDNLPPGTRVVRVMPNTPSFVGESASAFAVGTNATPQDAKIVEKLFAAVGLAFEVKEGLLDAVTGLSGSGPAYLFMVIEALSDGGVACGLPRDIATKLAAQTVLGSAKMVLETNTHPGALKDMVTSPGGTTIEGIHELEKAGIRAAFISAVRASAARAKALGQG